MACILSHKERDHSFLVFSLYFCPNKCFFHHKYATKKRFYKEFALQWYFVATLWINEVGGACKMNIKMALKSRSSILDLDHVTLSSGIFFLLGCLMKSFLRQPSGIRIYLYFGRKHTPKSHKFNFLSNFTCGNGSLVVPWSAIWVVFTLVVWLRRCLCAHIIYQIKYT